MNIVALRVTDSTNTASLASIANALAMGHQQSRPVQHHRRSTCRCPTAETTPRTGSPTTAETAEQVTNLIGQLTAMNIPVIAATGNSFTGAAGRGIRRDRRRHDQRDGDRPLGQSPLQCPAAGLGDRRRLGHDDRRAGRGLDRPLGRLRNRHGRRNQLRHRRWSPAASSLLQQIYESRFGTLPTVAQIKSWLQGGSDPINDPVTGITLGELNIPKAAALIPTAASRRRRPGVTPVTAPGQHGLACPTPSSDQRRPRRPHDHRRLTTPTPPTAPATPGAAARDDHGRLRRPTTDADADSAGHDAAADRRPGDLRHAGDQRRPTVSQTAPASVELDGRRLDRRIRPRSCCSRA